MSSETPFDILVTGGSGFLGSAIVTALHTQHPTWRISILDQHAPSPSQLAPIQHFFRVDITNRASVFNAFKSYVPDLVLHTAGIIPARQARYSTSHAAWLRVREINYEGTVNVLDATLASGCARFVYTSSCTVVIDDMAHDYFRMDEETSTGYATLHYGRSKGLAETYVMSRAGEGKEGPLICALRPSTIIGPEDRAVIPVMHDLIAKGETSFIVGDGDNVYDFVYIDNIASAHVLAAENLLPGGKGTAAGEVFFISNDEPVYFWDFLAYVWVQFGHVPRYRVQIPMWLAWAVAWILECITWVTGAEATLTRGSVRDAVRAHFADNEKAKRVLGYEVKVGLAEGVRRSCEGYKRYLARRAASSGE
ncbi:hypothetical protein BDY17DRAFT_247465 [Neohortaea acidophila]|uniref:3-beta hydroxysteroid dehydrogenase/isomerase domain-containing protein n=1 Tax=Neohortaea acidophila TaxID=245834 RepID=A0A6A6Q2E9_9PEZI|nr:uncharacterized protein BDY17DRAFT_247465 [Neohortaea acidophila]KAF2485843.1 hypothetical protein BDY17DRAFT_247465 [Neohortaea acidophila]